MKPPKGSAEAQQRPALGGRGSAPSGGSAFPETRGVPRGCLGLAPAPRERHHRLGKSDCHREPQMRRSQQRGPAARAEPGRVQQARGDSAGPRGGRRRAPGSGQDGQEPLAPLPVPWLQSPERPGGIYPRFFCVSKQCSRYCPVSAPFAPGLKSFVLVEPMPFLYAHCCSEFLCNTQEPNIREPEFREGGRASRLRSSGAWLAASLTLSSG
ncbi:uncharacterized protein LOC131494732 isoform X4 [Neofelis nebulosa]|uniref:uncharacterized protein LOC131494730 isoform X1 n=1 Tax=Neofelis nebulosa TaxID=61452 RepID=UPI00272A6994|nr:uncharacterized protein LOC131494730 isoform X1 [Neofelis nebulosa]XP_058555269.1 uncharacterized protein LOC131494732 isoform X4 [Neofelis nebulosa]